MTPRKRTGDRRRAGKFVCAGSKRTKEPRKPTKVDQLAQRHAAAAVKALVAVMEDNSASPAARISAAAALLQWGFGKAGSMNKAKSPDDPSGRKADYVIRLSWGSPAIEVDAATD